MGSLAGCAVAGKRFSPQTVTIGGSAFHTFAPAREP